MSAHVNNLSSREMAITSFTTWKVESQFTRKERRNEVKWEELEQVDCKKISTDKRPEIV